MKQQFWSIKLTYSKLKELTGGIYANLVPLPASSEELLEQGPVEVQAQA
jgi:hypothetical protein